MGMLSKARQGPAWRVPRSNWLAAACPASGPANHSPALACPAWSPVTRPDKQIGVSDTARPGSLAMSGDPEALSSDRGLISNDTVKLTVPYNEVPGICWDVAGLGQSRARPGGHTGSGRQGFVWQNMLYNDLRITI